MSLIIPKNARARRRRTMLALGLFSVGIIGSQLLIAAAPDAAPTVAMNATVSAPKTGNLTVANWGTLNNQTIKLYTLVNSKGLVVKISDYGARITSVLAPDRSGKVDDVILGYGALARYTNNGRGGSNEYGAVMGRVVNRINTAKFTIDGQTYTLASNGGGRGSPPFNLHSGPKGFDQIIWKSEIQPAQPGQVGLKLTYLSPDGENGFPGNVSVTLTYTLTDDNELKLDYLATTDKATPFNPANHAYWNLAGSNSGTMLNQVLKIEADKYTVSPQDTIPTGEIAAVAGTPFDFTQGKPIARDLQQVNLNRNANYDVNFVLRHPDGKVALAATLTDPKSGRVLEISTDEPGIQLYTAAPNYYGVALETQHFPDSTNHPNFPSIILRPGTPFKAETVWKFSTRPAATP